MKITAITDEISERGKQILQNSFLVNLHNEASYLAVKTVVEDGPYKVTTIVDDKQIRVNYFNKLQDAKDYVAFAMTHYPKPSQNIQLRIFNINDVEVETFTCNSDFSWFNKLPEECERLLPLEMMNSNLHRRSILRFNIRHDEYNPFIAKEY